MRRRYLQAGLLAIAADSWGAAFEFDSGPCEPFVTRGDYAVVDICGPLVQRAELCWDSYEEIEARICAALESQAPKVLLRINSPGGMVAGCFELVETIKAKAAAAGKIVEAYVDGMAASAAYALACSASRIYAPATAIVGSIGCIQVSVDQTAADRAMGLAFEVFASGARKADGNPHTPMSDNARASIQGQVDEMARTFFVTVASARPLAVAAIEALEAECFVATKGLERGLVDEIKTLEEVIAGAAGMQTATAAEVPMDDEEKEAKAALKALAEKGNEWAKKALAESEDGEEKKDDEDKSDAKAEDESEEKKDEEKKDDSEAKAQVHGLALAAKVQALEAKIAAKEESEERKSLLASRPDLAAEVVAFLERSPLAVVRDAVKTLPKGAAKGAVNQARAAINVAPPAASPSTSADAPYDRATAIALGLAAPEAPVRLEGNKLVLGVVTPEQARAEVARRQKEGAK